MSELQDEYAEEMDWRNWMDGLSKYTGGKTQICVYDDDMNRRGTQR